MNKLLQLRCRLSAFNPATLALSGAPGANYYSVYRYRRMFFSKAAALCAFGAGWYFYDFNKGVLAALAAIVLVWLVMPTVRSGYKKRQAALKVARKHVAEVEGETGVIHHMIALRDTRPDLKRREYDRLISLSFEKKFDQLGAVDLEHLILFQQDYLDAINLKLAEAGK
ncbi:hypothetical protein [Kistimonas asteriae]|uniref:hypothetical protein n=1 Tax=Kistimonas asteriae TaxID=517724 RepID=UPI001BA92357|nr:hypothetical protein [Kistimonas asteriae]